MMKALVVDDNFHKNMLETLQRTEACLKALENGVAIEPVFFKQTIEDLSKLRNAIVNADTRDTPTPEEIEEEDKLEEEGDEEEEGEVK